MYTLARNAASRYVTNPHNRPERNLSVSAHTSVSALIHQARSPTQAHQRTETKDRVRALRQQLSIEDQTLLLLHVDRGLSWRDLAIVMHEDGEQLEGEALTREASRLRKRFERLKSELRELAVAEGLIER
jgi:RNA polymerase sigma-70 factor (ECF subfamily)